MRRWFVLAPLAAALLASCDLAPVDNGLSAAEVARYVRKDVKDKAAWGSAVRDALKRADRRVDEDHVCQVLAIIEQESGYEADPVVPGLADVVQRELEAKAKDKLGPLAPGALGQLLDVAPEGSTTTFRQRLATVKTEQDVDVLFRDILAYQEARAPLVGRTARLLFPEVIDGLNPVGTAGSMQVSVAYARAAARKLGEDQDSVRSTLYTLEGGVLYGTLRLFEHEADYADPIFRFADYNAGYYASRNAAFQEQLGAVLGEPVALDGDLLIWAGDAPKPGQTMAAIERFAAAHAAHLVAPEARPPLFKQVAEEKSRAFESTAIWSTVRDTYAQRTGKRPIYARLPELALDSPKLRKDLTTRWFAEKVKSRYGDCKKRA